MSLSKDDWDNWVQHPVTKALRELARKEQEQLRLNWANGTFVTGDAMHSMAMNAEALGRHQMLAMIVNLEMEDFE